jgi:hypothetical protein
VLVMRVYLCDDLTCDAPLSLGSRSRRLTRLIAIHARGQRPVYRP